MTTQWKKETYVFDPRPHYPMRVSVGSYTFPDAPVSATAGDDEGYTLVFAHGTGFTKESWEPTIEDLLDFVRGQSGGKGVKVKEIWSIDAQNHGDSVELNEEILKKSHAEVFGWEEYGRVIHLFLSQAGSLTSSAGIRTKLDFSKEKLVGIGHSMGAASLVLGMGFFPQLKWDRVVLCDLMCMPDTFGKGAGEFLVGSAVRRRDVWASREEALGSLKKGRGRWDDRVLRGYVEFGLKDSQDGKGVTLKCSKEQEAASYKDPIGSRRAYEMLPHFVKRVQTHLIYGAEDDYLPKEVKEDILRVVGGKERLGGWARVPDSGHLIPQVNPRGLAEKVFEALAGPRIAVSARPKL